MVARTATAPYRTPQGAGALPTPTTTGDDECTPSRYYPASMPLALASFYS